MLESLLNKVIGLRPATLLKRHSNTGIFYEFREILQRIYFQEHLRTTASIAAFYTQRPGNYSICLSGQKFLAVIIFMKTNQVQRLFSA